MSVLKCKNKNCKNEFTPYTTLQRLCVPCAILKAKSAGELPTHARGDGLGFVSHHSS